MVNLLDRSSAGEAPEPSLSDAQLELLAQRRGDAARWCSIQAAGGQPLAHALRTPALEPDLEESASLPALEAALAVLTERRAELIDVTAPGGMNVAVAGRLLLCEFNMSIGSGESEVESRGFFDVMDRPPWDTWLVAFGRTHRSQPDQPIECVLSWVPEIAVETVDAGVSANRCGCLRWVDPLRT
jgi:hypothetical protein